MCFRESSWRASVHLNYLPISYDAEEFSGSILPFESREQLRELRRRHNGTHYFHRLHLPIDERLPATDRRRRG